MNGLLTSATAPPPSLRFYQAEAVDQIEQAYAGGNRNPILVLPTGSGKTVVAGEVIRREVAAGRSCLFLAPRRELVLQCSAALLWTGVDHGVFMAGREDLENHWASVTVASIDTVIARVLRRGRRPFPTPDLIVVDEAHLSITQRRQDMLEIWPDARLLGLTATPSRKDGKALGVLYDKLIEGASVEVLTRMGYLVPARYFGLSEPDLARVEMARGDYDQKQLDQAVNQPTLVADIVETWLKRAPERRTAVFATSIGHAMALAEAFQQVGVAAEHVNNETPLAERAEIFKRFADGTTQLLTNCFLMAYGFDLPAMSCIVLARPTKSLVMYLQMIGRGLRPAEGKSNCLVLDHSGAVHLHGRAADPRFWTLDGKYALDSPRNMACEAAKERLVDCPECSAVFSGTRICPECGYELKRKGKMVKTLNGELILLGADRPDAEIERRQFHGELRGLGIEKGWKPGAAAYRFQDRFGAMPPWDWNDEPALAPTPQTRRWVQSRNIAWHASRRAS